MNTTDQTKKWQRIGMVNVTGMIQEEIDSLLLVYNDGEMHRRPVLMEQDGRTYIEYEINCLN
jgi:hypothetical protein